MSAKIILIVATVVIASISVNASQQVMKDMTKNFLKAYEVCQKEQNLSENTAAELMYFWKEGYEVQSREAGCAIMCLTSKMNLIDPEGKLHRGNTVEFAKQHGSDDAMAHKIVDIVHACDASEPANEDHCLRSLAIALCFKREIHKLDWAPNPEVLMEELMAEMQDN